MNASSLWGIQDDVNLAGLNGGKLRRGGWVEHMILCCGECVGKEHTYRNSFRELVPFMGADIYAPGEVARFSLGQGFCDRVPLVRSGC